MGLWQTMLARLEYRLSLPTVWSFLKRFCKTAGRSVDKPDDFFISPDAVAATAFHLATQDPSAWSFEVEARPFKETW